MRAKWHDRRLPNLLNPYVLGVLTFAVAGSLFLVLSHAATSSVGMEAEGGTKGSCGSIVSDAFASGTHAIKFAPCMSGTGFVHPGVLLSTNQLDFVKAKIAAKAEPWYSEFNKAKADSWGSGAYTPHVLTTVDCGPKGVPNNGCTTETNDAGAAYTEAILWYYTGDSKYAQNAIRILNSWSTNFKGHTNYNEHLQAAWTGELFVPAAEIIRYTYTGWSANDIQKFTDMLNNYYLPEVKDIYPGGGANWIMSMSDATMQIAVWENNRTLFNTALSQWRTSVPSIIYMAGDNVDAYSNLKGKGYPIPQPGWSYNVPSLSTATMDIYWWQPGAYQTGLEGESCRDIDHSTMGFNGMINEAQTAYIQGVDLYSEQKQRIITGYEFNARYFDQWLSTGSIPATICNGKLTTPQYANYHVGWELAYSHYATDGGTPMPYTKAFIDKYIRPVAMKNSNFIVWPTLTSAKN